MASPTKFTSQTELVDEETKKKFSIEYGYGTTKGKTGLVIIAAVCVISMACLFAGIALMATSKACNNTHSQAGSAGKTDALKEQCKFSKEAQRIGLEAFLKKVREQFFKYHPENTAYHPDAVSDKEKIRKDYSAYDPTPAKIKERTDGAMALLAEINAQKEDPDMLKPREYKALLQVRHYLKYMFGTPYDENYYAADWMMGPNSFCWQSMCGLGFDIYNNIRKMKPRNYMEIEAVIKHIRDINATVSQYIDNMKLGVKTGMVRTKIECTGGLNAIKKVYEKISDNGPSGVYQWNLAKSIANATYFLAELPKSDEDSWLSKTGKTVNETIRYEVLMNIGTPLYRLLKYLENDHSKHCRPDDVGAGGLSALPVDYIYNNGTADMSKKTTKTLPIANKDGTYTIINGSKSYEKILGYFTTKTSTPDEVHQLGKKMLASLYPQVIAIAKNLTGISNNETMAIAEFKTTLTNLSMSFFNKEPIPRNESEGDAFKLCKTIEGAKKYCPNRWKAMEAWFSFARMAMSKLDPKTVNMFYFTGKKHTTPNCPVNLKPDFNPTSGAQSYQSTDAACSSTCIYNIPFFLKNLGPKFSEFSVNAHEARPGHHTQVQGNTEHFKDKCGGAVKWLDDQTYYTAFTEGWALYAENPLIAQQTDTYKDNLIQKFGMLKWQIWRALRLIVDTGLHYKGFSRQQALDLFAKYAWDKSDLAEKEVLRYQSNPGQATAYMIGQLDIWKYRNDTQAFLGKDFSLKEFHFQALSQGSSPLSYLESHLKRYRACKKSPKKEGCSAILNPTEPATASAAVKTTSDVDLDLIRPRRVHHI